MHPRSDVAMEQQAFFLLFLFVLFLISSIFINIFLRTIKTERKKKIPPGPWRFPIIGNLHLLDPNKPHHSFLNLSKKHGPLILLQLGSIPTLVVSSRDTAEEIFTNYDLIFSGRPLLTTPKKILYNFSSIAFAPHGDQWRQARKIVMLELLNPRRVRSFEAVRREEVEKLVATIKDLSVANLSELTLSLANNLVCRAAIGDEFGRGGYGGKGGVHLHELLSETQSLFGGFCWADLFPWMEWVDRLRGFHGRLEKNFEELDKFFDRIIRELLEKEEEERGVNIKNNDEEEKALVHALLRLHKDAVVHGGFLSSIDHVKAILVEAFIAGTDTTSATITWTMTELIRNPRVMNKLQEELKEFEATNDNACRLIQERDLEKLHYLKQVIKESMRLKPAAPLLVPRETIQSCQIQGYEIPAKTRVIINAIAISTDPNIWVNPLEFWPERFEGSKVDLMGQDFELLPFGSGRRKCPGISFAMVIVELVLANLLHCFDWSLPYGMKAEDVNMEDAIGITTRKKEPLCLVAKPKW